MFDKLFDPTFNLLKATILVVAIFIAFMLYLARKNKLEGLPQKIRYVLATLAFISFAAFYNFGFMHFGGGKYHTHDLFHYYMGSKYFKEVGYLYLYDATVIADKETNNIMSEVKTVRDQATYEHRNVATIELTKPEWREKFTDARWLEFKTDLAWFQTHPHNWQWWRGIVSDFGYNPPPGWTMAAQYISNLIPTSFELGMLFIAYLDGILAVIMFIMIWRAFGAETTFFSMIFWGCTYAYVFSFTGASMLRHDWIIYLVISMCLLKISKPKLSAFFLAYSAMLRILPIVYSFPLAFVFALRFLKNKTFDSAVFKYLVYYGVALVLIFSVTIVTVPGGFSAWLNWKEKMHVHKESWNTWNWGFVDIFIYDGEVYDRLPPDWKKPKEERLQELSPIIFLARAGMIALLALAALRLKNWEMIALGGVLFFMFFNPTKYYYVNLITLVPLFASRFDELWRVIGIAMLFGLTVIMHILHSFNNTAILIQFVFCMQVLVLYIITLLLICRGKELGAEISEPKLPNKLKKPGKKNV